MDKILESLSIIEKKVLPYLEEKSISEICKKSNLDKVTVLRALEYLNNKKIIELETQKKRVVDVGVNGALYKKRGLPERRLLLLLDEKRIILLKEAEKESFLSPDEFKVSLGVLRGKALIEIKNGKIFLNASKKEISRKTLDEMFIESLPLEEEKLTPEQHFSLKSLSKRKDIIEIEERKKFLIKVTPLGKKVMNSKEVSKDLIEQITNELLKKEQNWKNKKFRRYDVSMPVPKVYGGKRHFVNQAIDYARKIWTEMGFQEMEGNFIQSSFWVFDALFTAQDHPVREMQDTFFLGVNGELPDKKLVSSVKLAHEKGVGGSKGWNYHWDEEEAKRMVLRPHTTALSAKTLSQLKKEDFPKKYFAVGKVFRNETVDWSHGFEFYQTEGIVVDPDLNFRNLLGYLREFYKKMGFSKVRFSPAYFPYTEPSVEVNVWHPERKVWLELGGAGIFRPEITVPLLGVNTPVLAWGLGFDRIITDYYNIKDLRELYKNDVTQLRKTKSWVKV
ncbi:MAG: phenylalanine--tRNA ligase subunit alpha [Nanoarchaeota archaeon]|nr:phenylalanine--tRNA ligase subunit alpha [Nanoarchaeota archaeon]